jgi:hypothetical protein
MQQSIIVAGAEGVEGSTMTLLGYFSMKNGGVRRGGPGVALPLAHFAPCEWWETLPSGRTIMFQGAAHPADQAHQYFYLWTANSPPPPVHISAPNPGCEAGELPNGDFSGDLSLTTTPIHYL